MKNFKVVTPDGKDHVIKADRSNLHATGAIEFLDKDDETVAAFATGRWCYFSEQKQ